MKPYLTTRSLLPENQESPIEFLQEWQTDPTFFLRNGRIAGRFIKQVNI